MRRDLPPLPLTVRCGLGDYARTMMIKHILTICAAATAGVAAISLAQAQGYPVPPGSVYSSAPPAYPSDYRRGGPSVPDFDSLEDDEGPNSAALPPPGAVPPGRIMSPDDPRYGRPVYSDRNMPPARSSLPMIRAMDARSALRRSTLIATCLPARSSLPMIRATGVRPALRRSTPTAACPRARFFPPTTRVMVVPLVLR